MLLVLPPMTQTAPITMTTPASEVDDALEFETTGQSEHGAVSDNTGILVSTYLAVLLTPTLVLDSLLGFDTDSDFRCS